MTAARDAAESWFLERGLPAALTPRARSRYLVSRSAPALAAYATVVVALAVVFVVTGSSEIYIDGAPTPAEQIVLAVIALVVPLAVLVGWAVSRLHSRRAQVAVSIAAVLVARSLVSFRAAFVHLLATVVVIAVVAALTVSGAGAVLGWAVRLTMTQVAAMGALFVGALPVMLLTVVVFFNTYARLLASTISRTRLWIALLFLLAVTTAFIVSVSRSRVRPMLGSVSVPHDDTHDLDDTRAIPDGAVLDELTGPGQVTIAERL